MGALLAAGLGYSGCLYGQRTIPDDAQLLALQPPTIVPDSPTSPPLGRFILIKNYNLVTNSSVTFNVHVISDSPGPWFFQFIFNHDRGGGMCHGASCGVPATFPFSMGPVDGTGPFSLDAPVNIQFPTASTCWRLDVYVSHGFASGAADPATPVRPGDLAFGRWFVMTDDGSLNFPWGSADTLRTCFGDTN